MPQSEFLIPSDRQDISGDLRPTQMCCIDRQIIFPYAFVLNIGRKVIKRSVLENCSSNRRKLKMPALRYSVDGKHFENTAMSARVLPTHKSKTARVCCVFRSVSGEVWIQSI